MVAWQQTNSGRVRDQAGLPVPYTIRFSALEWYVFSEYL